MERNENVVKEVKDRLKKLNQRSAEIKKELTREMMFNTEKWKKFQSDYKKQFERLVYPQEVISQISVVIAKKELGFYH